MKYVVYTISRGLVLMASGLRKGHYPLVSTVKKYSNTSPPKKYMVPWML